MVDPPYYNNVNYAELSDFFYVWAKRNIGPLYPEFFSEELTPKDEEATANPARFHTLGLAPKKRKQLAERDYENKMMACFKQMHRSLADDGVVTVMFTHKQVEAWDTLGRALLDAGFRIDASWPVNTESDTEPAPGKEECGRQHDPAHLPQAAEIDRRGLVGRPEG